MPRETRPVCEAMLAKLRYRMDEDTGPAPIMSDKETVRECVSMEDMAALLKVAEAHGWSPPLTGHCTRPFGCVCRGDTAQVRVGCTYWVTK